jgi:hypothetical protein
MKKIKLPFLTLVALTTLAASCKKDKTKSNTELMALAPWKLIKAEFKTGTATTWTDITSSYAPCEKDDNYIFSANGTYENNEGASKCSPSDPQIIETGNWGFADGETRLYNQATGSSFRDTVSIELLNESNLVTQDKSSGSTTVFRTTLGH